MDLLPQGRKLWNVNQKLVDLKAQDCYENLDVLWKTSIMFGAPRPAWSGIMQFAHQGHYPAKAFIMFLPIIDSDTTCIYSTLLFICEHARKHGVTPVLTFDKNVESVKNPPELQLCGFST